MEELNSKEKVQRNTENVILKRCKMNKLVLVKCTDCIVKVEDEVKMVIIQVSIGCFNIFPAQNLHKNKSNESISMCTILTNYLLISCIKFESK